MVLNLNIVSLAHKLRERKRSSFSSLQVQCAASVLQDTFVRIPVCMCEMMSFAPWSVRRETGWGAIMWRIPSLYRRAVDQMHAGESEQTDRAQHEPLMWHRQLQSSCPVTGLTGVVPILTAAAEIPATQPDVSDLVSASWRRQSDIWFIYDPQQSIMVVLGLAKQKLTGPNQASLDDELSKTVCSQFALEGVGWSWGGGGHKAGNYSTDVGWTAYDGNRKWLLKLKYEWGSPDMN